MTEEVVGRPVTDMAEGVDTGLFIPDGARQPVAIELGTSLELSLKLATLLIRVGDG